MCGIAGFLDLARQTPAAELAATAAAMARALRQRGPDDEGTWVDAEAGVALAHRRLAVIDLSPAGHQPMVSACGRYLLSYNGEIYNFRELRAELEARGRRFCSQTDSEVLLEACAEWGLEATLPRLIGMFAFALWDRRTRSLSLARDRLGVKPLYWGRFGNLVLFGSQLSALRAHDGWTPELDEGALGAYLRHLYVPAPRSIYRGVAKLAPGHVLMLGADGTAKTQCYWDLRAIAAAAVRARSDIDAVEAAERLEALLLDAVGRRLVADVPLGAFLSGGIDSSLVTALMQARSARPVRSFTVGFGEARYDEAPHARTVAAHLGTEHTELTVTPETALQRVAELPRWFDEPFADPAQLPSLLISEVTRRHVTVALSGDGGDELFGGYPRYYTAEAWRRGLSWMPSGPRRAIAGTLRRLPGAGRGPLARHKLERLAARLGSDDEMALYRGFLDDPGRSELLRQATDEPPGVLDDPRLAAEIPDYLERMTFLDQATSLPERMLAKVDRASMACGLEVRVPLLDHRVVEFVWRLPPALKFRGRARSKALLRDVLYRYVPRALVERPKQGFAVPVKAWLRGPLRDWAEALLAEPALRADGIFEPARVRALWAEHLSGAANRQRVLWSVLMFQAWRAHDRRAEAAEAAPRAAAVGR